MMPSTSPLWTRTMPPRARSTAKRLLLLLLALMCLLPTLRAQSDPPIPPGDVRIHYFRPDGNYSGWALYTWNASTENASWCSSEVQISGTDAYGVYFDVSVNPAQGTPTGDLGFIINNCAENQVKDPGPDQHLQITAFSQAWIISGDATVYTSEPTEAQKLNSNFLKEQAYWLDRTRVAIQPTYLQSGNTYAIYWSLTGGLQLTETGVTGGQAIPLTPGGTLTQEELTRYPQLASYAVLTVSPRVPLATIKQGLKGQIAISSVSQSGALSYATGIQDAGVLDDIYYYSGKLGVVVKHSPDDDCWFDWADDNEAAVKLKLWAPTAQSVSLQLFDHENDAAPEATVAMHEHNGVWVARGTADWKGKYYLYSVNVYVPVDKTVDTNVTSDPYSIDIALNGAKSRITDLDSQATKPSGWNYSFSPPLNSLNDISIYELHIRDFSVGDTTVPAAHRGMYDAFADENTNGMRHLHALAESGLKAVHILPSFHFASVNEDKSTWQTTGDLSGDPPDGQQQQAAVAAIQSSDAYNWGYDPVHYMAPEGSYAINPDNRVFEYRTMVQGLHRAGLRVIQDVVFNHTNASGEAANSNLDEVVPLYYHRLDANGSLETGSCCPDTASEHRMMEKLMVDTLVMNAKEYKIDGFRFDLMSFHFTYNMQAIKQALAALTPLKDGVDGSKIYLYGEGWTTGETANGAIGPNASQANLYGSGVGTFNDRIRDGDRGGNPFADLRVQGFSTGLLTDSSDYTTSTTAQSDQLTALLQDEDWIRLGLAGNLRNYTFTSYTGATVTGAQINYGGQPAGYTASPIEAVNYCSVHDNQDIFDAVQIKSSLNDSSTVRARRQAIAFSVIELGQGVPFFQAGDDLLRSKDLDQNSFDSGDWFNKIDWSGRGANWGIGLPIASQNQGQWPLMQPLLSNGAYAPQPQDVSFSGAAFQEFMQIRYSSNLFRMSTLKEIQQNLSFLNTGTNQTPGIIVMKLDANGGNYGQYKHVVVIFNATNAQTTFTDSRLAGLKLQLHPVQQNSSDTATRESTFSSKTGAATVPALTTAVFVSERN
jgi:pullulanase